MRSAQQQFAPRGRRTWLERSAIVLGGVLTVTCVVAASSLGYLYWKTGRFQRVNLALDSAGANEPRNYLIIGSDSRDNVDPLDPDAGVMLGPGEPEGKRSDTILVVRIDPIAGTVQMLSFPRDLWLPIADTGSNERINTAYGRGRQVLLDTIRNDFGIEINNYIEVDFRGFKDLVSAVGGVPMYFDTPMRDANSGLDVEQTGCVTLEGDQALAFARARHLQFRNARGRWEDDLTADLGRITRQQLFVRRALDQVMTLGITDLPTFSRLLDVAVDSVTIDQTIDRKDLYSLVKRFKDLDPDTIETFSLPVTDHMTNGGAAVLYLKQQDAQPILDVFRGVTPSAAPREPSVTVNVMNGSGAAGQARDVRTALGAVGFQVGPAGNAQPTSRTIVNYPPGAQADADLLARHLTSSADLVEDRTQRAGVLELVTGRDFTTVMLAARPPAASATVADAAATPTDGALPIATDLTTTTTTTVIGIRPGEAPPGVTC